MSNNGNTTAPVLTPTHYGAATLAACGLVLWALGTYVFRGSGIPAEVQVAVYALLPGILGGVVGFFTRKDAKQAAPPKP